MPRQLLQPWGGLQRAEYETFDISDRFSTLPKNGATMLPFGNGRSYGDSCLNPGGAALRTKNLDHFISFDRETGVLACEAGVQLAEILQVVVPQGWFLSVTPGTRYVTIGGAIANDVHGKNHHRAGTFGCHVRRFELLRSDGNRMTCTANENPDWFAATIGGLGLTGLITWAEIQLRRVPGPWIAVETRHFSTLAEFMEISNESDGGHEYTVSWVDCSKNDGSGILLRGNHASGQKESYKTRNTGIPFMPPFSLINPLSVKIFNTLYSKKTEGTQVEHYEPFFYPLDNIQSWNRIYGPSGFYQYQCVIPRIHGLAPVQEILNEAKKSGMHSALSVLKSFGSKPSPGLLSFPCAGLTLAVDFSNQGDPSLRFFERLDAIVKEFNGRLYPAKDSRMPGALFRKGYPEWEKFSKFIDPQFSSGFWRRVMEGT